MNRISKRVSAACLALLMTASAGASSLPFSFSESRAVIVASAEGEQEQTAKQRYLTLLEEAKALSADDYSADSYALFTARLKKFDKSLLVNNYEKRYTDYEYDKLCKGVKYAMRLLNTDKSHTYYNDLEKLISYGESLDSNDYTEESYNKFLETFNSLKNGSFSLENARSVTKPVTLYEKYLEQNYYPCFALLQGKDYKEIVKEDSATGIKLISNSNVIPNECLFVVDSFDSDNWDWVNTDFSSNMKTAPSLCSNYAFYSFSIYNPDGSLLNIKDLYKIEIPIPEKFDLDNLSIDIFKNDNAGGAIANYSIDAERRVLVLSFDKISFIYNFNGASILITNPINHIDPLTIEPDGIYKVESNLGYATDVSRSSMANASIVHDSYLVKNGEDIDVYIDFHSMNIAGINAYCGGLWCDKGEKNDGQYYEDSELVYSYYTNEDGSIRDNAIYDGVTEINCPKTIKLHLERSAYSEEFGGYILAVCSPEMAAMNGLTIEEVRERWDELACVYLISNPRFIDTLDNAANYLPTYDKSALRYEIDYSKSLDELDYTAESWQNLMDVVDIAQAKYDGEATTTEEITEQIGLVQAARDALVIDDSEDGDKADLEALVAEAKKLNEDDYTKSSWSALQDALASAEKVLAKEHAKQPKIDAAKDSLQSAIDALEKKPETALDKDNLADGKYTLTAEMIKTDRKSKSMSNNAINHTVQLEVVDGEYFVTMQFKGLAIYNQFGYLKDLGYYDAGYTYNDYGIPQGTVLPAEVLSTYDTVDQYNDADNLYPQLLKFKLVDKASADFVPLQVFVPIMEAIAEGTGTQDVLMQLDWSTLVKVDDDAPIDIEEPEEQSPAVDLTDAATGVKIHADKGVFEEGVQLVVTPVTSGSDFDNAKKALDGTAKAFNLYEIHFVDKNGSTVQPNGTVSVSIPVPADYSDKLAVYRINDNAGKTLMSGEAKDGYYTYLTKSFSLYALADTNVTASTTPAENKPADNGSGNPQTGAAAMGFAGIALAGAALILARRKEK